MLKNKRPKIRFPEFKDAWEHKQLNELLYESKARNTDLKYGKDKVLSVSGELGIVNQIEHLGRSYAGVSVHQYHVVEVGDIVYTKSPLKANPFGIIKLNKGKAGIVSTLYAVYKVNKNTAFGPFIDCYFSLDVNTNRYLRPLVKKGAKNDMKINNAYVLHDKIFVPAIVEQQKIASFLSAVDKKIQLLNRKKQLLEQYKKGVMQQLFSGKLRFKGEEGKAYPKWIEKKLEHVGEIVSGLTYSPNDIHQDGVLVLRSSNVQGRRLSFEDNVYVNVSEGGFNPVKENDILICVRNGSKNLIGKNAIISKKNAGLAFGAFMTVFRSKYNLFLFHYFDSDMYKNEVHKNLGATINSINGSDLKKFKIPFPSEPEQKKIADLLSAIDVKIEILSSQITQTQNFKKGLLQQMFV